MTTSLAHIQESFQRFLLDGDPAIEAHVVDTKRVPAATRLGIYSNAYRLRLIEALQANYPALATLLGDAEFGTLGTAYIKANPSHFFSIRYYGHRLADFLAQHASYASAPVLADLARWEWAMTEAFDAADAAPIAADALAGVPPEEWAVLQFDWHPSVRRLDLAWNAPQIWKALTSGSERPQAAVQPEPVPWLLWRRDLQIFFRSLEPVEAAALDAVRGGRTFGELCESLCAHVGEEAAPAQAARFLREWIESGLITGFRSV